MAQDNKDNQDKIIDKTDANPDPITGAPGSHPIGTGIGAAGAGTAGAAIGAVAGPVGALAGAAIGAVAGAIAGHSVGELVNPTVEDEYWNKHYSTREYVEPGVSYQVYRPAYRYGWEARSRTQGKSWDEVETHLGSSWNQAKGESSLTWDKARFAARDAWNRIDTTAREGTEPSAGQSTPDPEKKDRGCSCH